MPKIVVDGISSHYQDIGKHTKVVLLLHGWGHSWETWAEYVAELSAKYRVILPDLPGFGQSDSPQNGWSMSEYVDWLQKFLKQLAVEELHAVVGHSFGGKLASFAWLTQYKKHLLPCQRIFLLSASGIPSELSWKRRATRTILSFIPHRVKRSSFTQSLRKKLYLGVLQEADYVTSTSFQEQTLRKILTQDIRHVALSPQKQTGTLKIAWGEDDDAVPIWMAYEFAKLHSESNVFVIPECGHLIHHSHPALIKTWLWSWL